MIHLYKCFLPSQNSVFFFKLVIVYTFFDLTYDLLRVNDLIYYIFNCFLYTRTEAEYARARQKTLPFSFNYVTSFTTDLLIFSIVVIYSVSCPLIAPAGLLYMVAKHYLDRYKIYYINSLPNRISLAVHKTVLFIVLMSFFFLLLQMTAFLTTSRSWSWSLDPGIVILVAFILYSLFLLLFSWCFFGLFLNDTLTRSHPTSQITGNFRSSRRKSSRRRSSKNKKSGSTHIKMNRSTKRESKKRSIFGK